MMQPLFTPDAVFIYNLSDVSFYMSVGTPQPPVAATADLVVPSGQYGLFVPYKNTHVFGGYLPGVTQWNTWVIFRKGQFVEGKQESDFNPFPDPGTLVTFPTMPSIVVVAGFTFVVSP